MSQNDVVLNIRTNVENSKDLVHLRNQLERFGGASEEISEDVDTLVQSINDIAVAQEISDQVAEATQALEEQGAALDHAKKQYDEATEALSKFGEAMSEGERKEAEESIKSHSKEIEKLSRSYKKAEKDLAAANKRYDQSSNYVKRLASDASSLEEATRLATESQEILNRELEELKELSLAGKDLGVIDYQAEIDKLTASYETLKSSGTLSATELESAHRRLTEQVSAYRREVDGSNNAISQMKKGLPAFVATTAAFGKMTKDAIDFETAMSGVSKVLGESDEVVKKLGKDLVDLSKTMPTTADELAKIAESGAQMGLAADELLKYTENIAKIGVAFNISADQSGKAVADLMNIFDIGIDGAIELADAINHLSNNSAADAESIINVLTRIGGAGKNFGLVQEELAALSASFLSLGMTPEVAGTAINGFLTTLATAESKGGSFDLALQKIGLSSVELAQQIRESPQEALLDLLNTLNEAGEEGENVSLILTDLFGVGHQSKIALMANSVESLATAFDLVGDKGAYAGSVNAEAAAQAKTTANQLNMMKNSLTAISIELGEHLLPLMIELSKGVSNIAQKFADFAEVHPNVVRIGMAIIAASASIKVATGALKLMSIQASTATRILSTGLTRVTGQARVAALAIRGIGQAAMIAGSVFAGWELGNQFRETSQWMERAQNATTHYIASTTTAIKGMGKSAFSALTLDIEGAKKAIDEANDSLLRQRSVYEEMQSLANSGTQAERRERERKAEEELAELREKEIEQLAKIEALRNKGEGVAARDIQIAGNKEYAESLERVVSLLEEQGLSYSAIEEGITKSGNEAVNFFNRIVNEAGASSAIIRESFINALEGISTPVELEALISKLTDTSTTSKIAQKDFDFLTESLTNLRGAIEEGTQAGAEFDSILRREIEALDKKQKGLFVTTKAHEDLRREIELGIAQSQELINAEISALEAERALAQAKGDSAREQELINEISSKSIELLASQIEPMQQLVDQDKQIVNELLARKAANEALTQSELEQIKVLEHSIQVREREISALKSSSEAAALNEEKRRSEILTRANTEATDGHTESLRRNSRALSTNRSALNETSSALEDLGKKSEETATRGAVFTSWLSSTEDTALLSAYAIEQLTHATSKINEQFDRRVTAPTAMLEFYAKQRDGIKKEAEAEIAKFKQLKLEIEALENPTVAQTHHFERLVKSLKYVDEKEVSIITKQLEGMRLKSSTAEPEGALKQLSDQSKSTVSDIKKIDNLTLNQVTREIDTATERMKDFGQEAKNALQQAQNELDDLLGKSSDYEKSALKASELREKAFEAELSGDWQAGQQLREAANLVMQSARIRAAQEGAEESGEKVTIELIAEAERAALTANSREDYERFVEILKQHKGVAR